MRTLPPPPPPPAASNVPTETAASRRPGELTSAWRAAFIIGWGCVLLGFVAVGRSARNLGLSTWWLGPRSDPNLLLIQLIPSLPAVALIVMAARRVRFLPYFGVAGAIVLAAIATGDVGRFDRLAVAEFVIAAAALLISVASFAGLLRRDDAA
jgi:hypothetical protein